MDAALAARKDGENYYTQSSTCTYPKLVALAGHRRACRHCSIASTWPVALRASIPSSLCNMCLVMEAISAQLSVAYTTRQPYMACSSESKEGLCDGMDGACSALTVATTCATFREGWVSINLPLRPSRSTDRSWIRMP